MLQQLPSVVTEQPGALGLLLIGMGLMGHFGLSVFRLLKNGKSRPSGEHVSPGWIETAKEYEGRLSGLETSREYQTEELSGFRTALQDFRLETREEFARLRERLDRAIAERGRP